MLAPNFKTEPYWWEARPGTSLDASTLPDESDVLCVGSGYSGLSTALELARAGISVTVIDAEEIGFGASTRNGGMLSAEPKFAPRDQMNQRFGTELTQRIREDGRAAFKNLLHIIDREGIDCELQLNGRFVGAHSVPAFRSLEAKLRELEAEKVAGFEIISRERQHEIIGDSRYYYGGLLERRGGTLHPALYHWGLLEACRRHGVRFCEKNRVLGIRRDASQFVIDTELGQCQTREVMLGTNGYTGGVTPWQQRRVIPVASHIIATEEIGEERVESMFRGYCSMSNTQRILFYYRPSPDHRRIVFGGRAAFGATDVKTFARRLHSYMCRVYPQLEHVSVTHAWTGNVAFTFDYLPHMGEQDGVHYCMGCNGGGVAMMSYLGREVALKILGRVNRPCAFETVEFPDHALYRGTPWFLPLVGTWYRLRDTLERGFR